MVIFHSYVSLPEGNDYRRTELHRFTTFSYIDWLNFEKNAELYWPEVNDSDIYNTVTH